MNTIHKKRDTTIDIVRSIAIALMVSANMATLGQGEPLWIFRLISSLAAPIFIMLASMMVILGLLRGKGIKDALIKCAFLFVVGILFDLSNFSLPFKNIDVLYLIGLSLVFVSIVGRFAIRTLLIMIIIILCLTPYLQLKLGYQHTILLDLTKENLNKLSFQSITELLHRYFIDGWFPLFPWIAISIFGAVLGKLRYSAGTIISFAQSRYVIKALFLTLLGILIWWIFPDEQARRYGYIELFYPPTPGFMIFVMGMTWSIICLMDYVGDVSIWAVLHPLGEASLFMYLFHIAVIEHILDPLGPITFGLRYAIYNLILLTIMIIIGLLLRKLRNKPFYRNMPHVVKWVLG